VRITFEAVSFRGSKSVKCAGGCGRKLTRSKTFCQTINPWNKTAWGTTKTYDDIYPELIQSASEWRKAPEWCKHCMASEAKREEAENNGQFGVGA
jgi:hypothetical protein